ncbi:unnamed protein product [Clavelina lepadiformis]|uniref:Uncharacterized protein n=1 Tax=Clavelina lepadiformis TaxID=159417 RepID=A0ABP0FKU1_CLALP
MYQETRNSAILFLLGLFNCNVMARDCFQCSYIEGLSSTQRDCKEPASTSALLKNCPAGQNYCLTVTSNGPAGNTVTRGCSSNAVPYDCLTILGERSCTSTCKESGCNNKVFAN